MGLRFKYEFPTLRPMHALENQAESKGITAKTVCVFCGAPPASKSKEHVIPQWLLKHVGVKDETVRMGFQPQTGELRQMVYKSFTFPACQKCNNDASTLEATTKPIILKLLSCEPVSQNEFCTLLDWFDKVRIGLWLGFYYLNRNVAGIEPKFHIQSRLGMQDRMLHIVSVDNPCPELTFRGADTLSFHLNPCCFSMIIKNLCFYNISSPFLFARRIGFPFPAATYLRDDGLIDVIMKQGLARVIRPLLKTPFAFQGVGLYQPIFKAMLSTPYLPLYKTPYVLRNVFSAGNGKGRVFIQNENGKVHPYPSGASSAWLPSKLYKRVSMNPAISVNTLRYQLSLEPDKASRSKLSQENQLWWNQVLRKTRSEAKFLIKAVQDNSRTNR
jgi:hypothetical protein